MIFQGNKCKFFYKPTIFTVYNHNFDSDQKSYMFVNLLSYLRSDEHLRADMNDFSLSWFNPQKSAKTRLRLTTVVSLPPL